ncbi:AI-2E family transporter [Paeniroseomonas aquatica]|uniref:AI-2E family transporter n=1 Tax=Paeniroseomonas aquatica TaxID=373043 RepID=A0ABT8AGN7_9PROT|nr:AI-2E family transporter [Paeniroseomonas aquatica]MDN3568989.1 AI-2E family transporter [Paeniroseomonas aquatica]
MPDHASRWMLGLCTGILVAVALHLAEAVLAPVAFALFAIALAWPVQRAMQSRAPQLVALLAAVLVTLVVLVLLALAIGWGFGRVARWVIANAAQLQALYAAKLDWLEARGIGAAAALAGEFDMRQLVRIAQAVILQLQGVLGFLGLTLVFVILGLLEVAVAGRQLARLGRHSAAAAGVLRALTRTAARLRAYMLVRTVMSIATGIAVWGFARLMGLELAAEWGVIAFVLNYIPFIGPLLAILFPTFFAALQFGSWQAALTVFVVLQAIQFLSGSTLEPRLAGARLALSPFMVLVAVFLGALLWGIPGAFIGVPALILALALCQEFPGSRWVAELLSGRVPAEGAPPPG